MANFTKINQLFGKLSSADRYAPGCPRPPAQPRGPREYITNWERLSGAHYDGSEKTLDVIVREALAKAGINYEETLPANVIEALERTLVTAEHDDGDRYLTVDWEVKTLNPIFESENAVYQSQMLRYEEEVVQFERKLEDYVTLTLETRRIRQEQKDLEELKRLQEIYGSEEKKRKASERHE